MRDRIDVFRETFEFGDRIHVFRETFEFGAFVPDNAVWANVTDTGVWQIFSLKVRSFRADCKIVRVKAVVWNGTKM